MGLIAWFPVGYEIDLASDRIRCSHASTSDNFRGSFVTWSTIHHDDRSPNTEICSSVRSTECNGYKEERVSFSSLVFRPVTYRILLPRIDAELSSISTLPSGNINGLLDTALSLHEFISILPRAIGWTFEFHQLRDCSYAPYYRDYPDLFAILSFAILFLDRFNIYL